MTVSNNAYSKNKLKPGKATAFFICIAVSSLLWLLHALNTIYDYSIIVPVSFKNLPQNKIPISQIPNHLKLDLKASGLKLLLISANNPFSQIDIDFNRLKTTNKQNNYVLESGSINFISSIKFVADINHITPDTLYFAEKNGYQKNVPVKVPLFLTCAQGYGNKKPVISPSYITILGDTAIIKKIDTIYTQPLNLVNLNKSYNSSIVIIKPNSFINISEADVNVSIDVDKLVEHSISIPVNVIKNNKYKEVAIFPSKINLKYTCLKNNFNINDTLLFKASVDITKTTSFNKSSVFLSTVPGNVNILNIHPKEVEFLIIKK